MRNEQYAPGGGLLKRTTPLSDDEWQQYIDFFAGKNIRIMP